MGYGAMKTTKPPDLPQFSGALLTPKEEVAFETWIFQVRHFKKSYTEDAVKNAIFSKVRGTASMVVRACGFNAELDEMIRCLHKQFSMGQADDDLLKDFHQMVQGPHELVQDYGVKLECQFRCLQECFPRSYILVQLKEHFFYGMNDGMVYVYTAQL